MDYNRIYNQIITRATGRKKLRRDSPEYVYYEKHHIIPRCLGGTDEKNNLVFLTAEEHWIVHLLLTKIYPNNTKLVFACQAMSMVSRNNKRTTNKLFGWVRRKYSEAISKTRAGRKLSDDHKLRISKTLKGRPLLHQQGENNVSKRPEVAKKISEANKGRVLGPRSDETKSRISAATKGRKGLTGDANPSSWRVSCIKCKKETSIPILGKHHKKCV